MLDVALLGALGAAWLVAMLLMRRLIVREVLARKMSIGTAAVIFGLVWSVVPLPALIWRPEALAVIVFSSALLFFVSAGTLIVMARMLEWR